MRLAFRTNLIQKANLSKFPPYGMHVLGMQRQMYEGFIQSIDTHLQLYGIVKGGSYNTRSVSSLTNETFFGEMPEFEQTNLGCPKATHCPRLVSSVTELLHYRHNPQNRYMGFLQVKRDPWWAYFSRIVIVLFYFS